MRTKFVAPFLFILSAMLAFGVLTTPATHAQGVERLDVLIGFKKLPGPAEEALVRAGGGRIKYTYHLVPAIAARVPEPAIFGLLLSPNVTHVDPDGQVWAVDEELDNSWGVERIGAGIVHAGGNKGAGVKVAIIDTGIDYDHPDLDANYAGGYDFVNTDTDPMDDAGHGTHVAGTVAAEDNDDPESVVGVAPEARLYALKVLDETGRGYYSDIIAALQWCVDYEMDVTNNSYGSSGDPGESVKAAFDNAYEDGVLHVCAAGNSGNPRARRDNVIYPARYDSCIAVAATNQDDERATWSSTGPDVELSAPGVGINSTLLGGGYGEKSGTSMASPHVAGTAALVWVAYPFWTNDEVRHQLLNTADDLGDAGWDAKYGYGLVDADEAAPDTTPPEPTHDVAVLAVRAPSPVYQGDDVPVDVDAENQGTFEETFDVVLTEGPDGFTDSTTITLAAGASTTVSFGWPTSESTTLSDHTLTVTAGPVTGETDTADNSGGTTVTVGEEPPAATMHVDSIHMGLSAAGINTWAVAAVTIVDADEIPVEGVTVSGRWTDATSDADSGVTGSDGKVALQSDRVKRASTGTTFTFTVDSVVRDGWTYDPASNVETSDSIVVP